MRDICPASGRGIRGRGSQRLPETTDARLACESVDDVLPSGRAGLVDSVADIAPEGAIVGSSVAATDFARGGESREEFTRPDRRVRVREQAVEDRTAAMPAAHDVDERDVLHRRNLAPDLRERPEGADSTWAWNTSPAMRSPLQIARRILLQVAILLPLVGFSTDDRTHPTVERTFEQTVEQTNPLVATGPAMDPSLESPPTIGPEWDDFPGGSCASINAISSPPLQIGSLESERVRSGIWVPSTRSIRDR